MASLFPPAVLLFVNIPEGKTKIEKKKSFDTNPIFFSLRLEVPSFFFDFNSLNYLRIHAQCQPLRSVK